MSRPRLVLVGPPGAGKSTIGPLLAEHWQVPFRDTDDDIAVVAGKSIPDIFFSDGEDAFRALEREAVRAALAAHPGVLSLGGGAVLAEQTRALLVDQNVAFLNVALTDAVRRVGLSAARPVLALNPRAQLIALLEARLPLYREVATVEVDTTGLAPEQVVEAVLTSVQV